MVFPPVRKEEETDRSDEFLFKLVTRTFRTLALSRCAIRGRFQYRRKSSRCQREPRVWLNDQKGLLPGANQPGQHDEEDAIGPGERWPFHFSPENDELLA